MEEPKRKKLISDPRVKPKLDLCDHVLDKVRVVLIQGQIKARATCSVCNKEVIF
jgi:hypothetical protein